LLRLVFGRGRYGPMIPFSVHHPAFLAGAALIAGGAAFALPGWLLIRRARQVRRTKADGPVQA